jgi:hypothetical protein
MKLNSQAKPYFSAYPLKAIDHNPRTESLHNSDHKPPRMISRSRVMPMVNPYGDTTKVNFKRIKAPVNMLSEDEQWYNHYE